MLCMQTSFQLALRDGCVDQHYLSTEQATLHDIQVSETPSSISPGVSENMECSDDENDSLAKGVSMITFFEKIWIPTFYVWKEEI